jgi:transcriptional regulator with XRE-family HTH domain
MGVELKKTKRSSADDKWLAALGAHLEKLIAEKGYKSAYDFWIQACGEDISRGGLSYALRGAKDVRATTLKKLAEALGVEPKEILNFRLK